MRSKLADAARRSQREALRRVTPEQRLAAFLAHCQLMAQLQLAGSSLKLLPSVAEKRHAG
jgi:hypothetical protein